MTSAEVDGSDPTRPSKTLMLALQVQAGDLGSFRQLYERVGPSLYAWARVRSNPSQGLAIEPEDLLQETWMRALDGIASFDGARTSFRAWIFGIAKHVAYDAWRSGSSARDRLEGATSSSRSLESWPEVRTSIASRLGRDESIQKLMDHVSGFDPLDRMLLIHCGMEGASSTAIAARAGVTPDTAAKRWQRLRARLLRQPFAALLDLES
jgi:RNA polymerase sigma factor (sigma-70 family)